MTDSEVLRQAAVWVRHRWIQFSSIGENGGVCALGAINKAIDADFSFPLSAAHLAQENRVIKALTVALSCRSCSTTDIVEWNDTPGQTAENVANALELAAVVVEEQAKQIKEREVACV